MEVALTVAFLLAHFDMHLTSSQNTHKQPSITPGTASKAQCKPLRTPFPESGDPHGLLPLPETRRQVGIRWPRIPCEIEYKTSQ